MYSWLKRLWNSHCQLYRDVLVAMWVQSWSSVDWDNQIYFRNSKVGTIVQSNAASPQKHGNFWLRKSGFWNPCNSVVTAWLCPDFCSSAVSELYGKWILQILTLRCCPSSQSALQVLLCSNLCKFEEISCFAKQCIFLALVIIPVMAFYETQLCLFNWNCSYFRCNFEKHNLKKFNWHNDLVCVQGWKYLVCHKMFLWWILFSLTNVCVAVPNPFPSVTVI